jgi:hypothetical protein
MCCKYDREARLGTIMQFREIEHSDSERTRARTHTCTIIEYYTPTSGAVVCSSGARDAGSAAWAGFVRVSGDVVAGSGVGWGLEEGCGGKRGCLL